MIISINAEKSLQKIKYPFMIKKFNKPGIKEKFFNLIKLIFITLADDISMKRHDRYKTFP